MTVTISNDDLRYLLTCAMADIDGSKVSKYVSSLIDTLEGNEDDGSLYIELPGPDCGRCDVNCTCPTGWYCKCGEHIETCGGCNENVAYRGVICPTCGYSEVGKRCNCPKVTEVTKPLMDAI